MWRTRTRPFAGADRDAGRFARLEPAGSLQSELKARLALGLGGLPNVRAAYLVGMVRGGATGAALCVRTELGDDGCVRRIAADALADLPIGTTIDVVFVGESDERALRRVCAPFYVGRA